MHIRRLGRRDNSSDQGGAGGWDASAPPPSGPVTFQPGLRTAGELAGPGVHPSDAEDHPETGTAA